MRSPVALRHLSTGLIETLEISKRLLILLRANTEKSAQQTGNRQSSSSVSPKLLHAICACPLRVSSKTLGSVDVHLSQSIVAAIEMKAEKLVSVLQ